MSNNTEFKILTQSKEDTIEKTSSKNTRIPEKTRRYNIISSKVFTISLVLKWLGYLSSIIVFIIFSINNQIAEGLLKALISALSTFIATTLLDGFAEIIQLLEDIKNK